MNKNNNAVQTGAIIGVSRSRVFQLWKTKQLKSVLVGGKRFSTDRQIDEFLARLEQAAEDPRGAA
ncbi:MAG: hypothetical protein EKK51_00190 [Mycolicibacterium sp.]|uniref:hypothetical protein n=1 Tax=Mycolicibacterium sp. TaxID=2320850 RepID=UPI000FA58CF3|nr:hypothetical protein [Mycolicibacterium sp.]RUP35012.1 MAG: hypothetical protein EKK51_00190 [Mycolicibacterium sp.]